MNKVLRGALVFVLIGALAGAGIWLWRFNHGKSRDNTLVLYGNVDIRQVELAFNDSQRIATMLVREGDRVKKGQLLAILETERLEYAVARFEGQVESQKQVVARLLAGSRPEEIRKARADTDAAIAQAANAALLAQRRGPLAAQNAVSKEEAEIAKYNAQATEAQLKSARETLQLAVIGPRVEDIASAKASFKALEADLALAKKELADAYLYAPSDGIIQDRILEPGDMVTPQKPVYTIALIDPLWVRAYVSEQDVGKLRPGMLAEVTTDSFPGKHYRAWVGFLSPTAQFTPKTVETTEIRTSLVYQVRVYVCNPEDELRLGMPATVHIRLDQPRQNGGPTPQDPCKSS